MVMQPYEHTLLLICAFCVVLTGLVFYCSPFVPRVETRGYYEIVPGTPGLAWLEMMLLETGLNQGLKIVRRLMQITALRFQPYLVTEYN